MKIRRGRVLFLLLALASICVPVAPAATAARTAHVVVRADVTIDAGGRIQSLAWHEQNPLQEMVAGRVEDAVRTWQFEPARIDGVPAETRTGLAVRVAIEPMVGDFNLHFEGASTGAVSVHTPPPAYPQYVARRGGEGAVAVTLDVAPDGSAEVVDAVMLGDRLHAWRGKFIPAVKQAASKWTFRPETVGGRSIPARVTVAVRFELCDRCGASGSSGGAESTAGEAVPSGSMVSLRTDIRGRQI